MFAVSPTLKPQQEQWLLLNANDIIYFVFRVLFYYLWEAVTSLLILKWLFTLEANFIPLLITKVPCFYQLHKYLGLPLTENIF